MMLGRTLTDAENWQNLLCLFDGFRLRRANQPVTVPAGGQRLVALLALVGPRSRLVAAATLWPDASDDRAHGNLRSSLWRLKRLCPGLVCAHGDYLAIDSSVVLDTAMFVACTRAIVRDREPLTDYADAVAVVGVRELLPGWYDDWVVAERERLRLLALNALERLSSRLVADGMFALAMEAALEAVHAEPLRESAHRALIAVHLAQGNVDEARRHFARLTELLRRELGVAPSHLAADLLQRVQSRRPAGGGLHAV
jgi:DNA-binding SARP family transcriptional activator